MGKTYNNQVNEYEVSLGIERLLIAHYPQSWSPARIDIDTPPTGFYDLGAVVEDTPSWTYTRGYFELDAGLPAVTQYRAVTSMEGTFAVSLHSNSWKKLQFALGNYTASGGFTNTAVVSYDAVDRMLTIAGTSAASSFAADRIVTLTQSGTPDDPDSEVSRVSSVSAVSTTTRIYLATELSTALTSILAGGGFVSQQVTPGYNKMYYGGASIKNYALLGVVDFIDGTQVVHYIPKASPNADVVEEYRPEQNSRFPMSFKAFGVRTTIGSCSQVVVAERYEFPSISAC